MNGSYEDYIILIPPIPTKKAQQVFYESVFTLPLVVALKYRLESATKKGFYIHSKRMSMLTYLIGQKNTGKTILMSSIMRYLDTLNHDKYIRETLCGNVDVDENNLGHLLKEELSDDYASLIDSLRDAFFEKGRERYIQNTYFHLNFTYAPLIMTKDFNPDKFFDLLESIHSVLKTSASGLKDVGTNIKLKFDRRRKIDTQIALLQLIAHRPAEYDPEAKLMTKIPLIEIGGENLWVSSKLLEDSRASSILDKIIDGIVGDREVFRKALDYYTIALNTLIDFAVKLLPDLDADVEIGDIKRYTDELLVLLNPLFLSLLATNIPYDYPRVLKDEIEEIQLTNLSGHQRTYRDILDAIATYAEKMEDASQRSKILGAINIINDDLREYIKSTIYRGKDTSNVTHEIDKKVKMLTNFPTLISKLLEHWSDIFFAKALGGGALATVLDDIVISSGTLALVNLAYNLGKDPKDTGGLEDGTLELIARSAMPRETTRGLKMIMRPTTQIIHLFERLSEKILGEPRNDDYEKFKSMKVRNSIKDTILSLLWATYRINLTNFEHTLMTYILSSITGRLISRGHTAYASAKMMLNDILRIANSLTYDYYKKIIGDTNNTLRDFYVIKSLLTMILPPPFYVTSLIRLLNLVYQNLDEVEPIIQSNRKFLIEDIGFPTALRATLIADGQHVDILDMKNAFPIIERFDPKFDDRFSLSSLITTLLTRIISNPGSDLYTAFNDDKINMIILSSLIKGREYRPEEIPIKAREEMCKTSLLDNIFEELDREAFKRELERLGVDMDATIRELQSQRLGYLYGLTIYLLNDPERFSRQFSASIQRFIKEYIVENIYSYVRVALMEEEKSVRANVVYYFGRADLLLRLILGYREDGSVSLRQLKGLFHYLCNSYRNINIRLDGEPISLRGYVLQLVAEDPNLINAKLKSIMDYINKSIKKEEGLEGRIKLGENLFGLLLEFFKYQLEAALIKALGHRIATIDTPSQDRRFIFVGSPMIELPTAKEPIISMDGAYIALFLARGE